MATTFFKDIINPHFDQKALLDIRSGGKVLVISDFHMGNGGRTDDLIRNASLLKDLLKEYYLPNDYHLILNGDIEELQRFSLSCLRKKTDYTKILAIMMKAFSLKKNIPTNCIMRCILRPASSRFMSFMDINLPRCTMNIITLLVWLCVIYQSPLG